MAFQLADDLIDIASDAAETGKTPGTDLREGVDTLAVLYAKAGTDPRDARLRELLAGDLRDDDRHRRDPRPAARQPRARAGPGDHPSGRSRGGRPAVAPAGLRRQDRPTALVTSVVDRVG